MKAGERKDDHSRRRDHGGFHQRQRLRIADEKFAVPGDGHGAAIAGDRGGSGESGGEALGLLRRSCGLAPAQVAGDSRAELPKVDPSPGFQSWFQDVGVELNTALRMTLGEIQWRDTR